MHDPVPFFRSSFSWIIQSEVNSCTYSLFDPLHRDGVDGWLRTYDLFDVPCVVIRLLGVVVIFPILDIFFKFVNIYQSLGLSSICVLFFPASFYFFLRSCIFDAIRKYAIVFHTYLTAFAISS